MFIYGKILLDYWIIGLLDYWIIGLLDYWIIGLLDYWIIGLLDYWIIGLLDYCIIGLLDYCIIGDYSTILGFLMVFTITTGFSFFISNFPSTITTVSLISISLY